MIKMKKIMFVYGTRPEAIKMAPLVKKMNLSDNFNPVVCLTGQHKEMVNQINSFFSIKEDFNLDIMKPNQTLFDISINALEALKKVISKESPDAIIVQGDTSTAFIGALSSFYYKIPVIHLEAGLRTDNKFSPYPEEVNRRLISQISSYNLCPTEAAFKNLKRDNILDKSAVVGNTVIDALYMGRDLVLKNKLDFQEKFDFLNSSKDLVLVTAHRRENHGKPLENICDALKDLAEKYTHIEFLYPVHPNPNVRNVVEEKLSDIKNIHLVKPLDYPDMIYIMDRCKLILTDSGGLQEEGPALGKPVLVLRDTTERPEGIEAGVAKLIGTSKEEIIDNFNSLIQDKKLYESMSKAINPYGDGKTSDNILKILRVWFD